MDNSQRTVKQDIVQLILKWKLTSADVRMQKDGGLLSDADRAELSRLLDQYRAYDRTMFSAQENADKNPAAARMMMNRAVLAAVGAGAPGLRKTAPPLRSAPCSPYHPFP